MSTDKSVDETSSSSPFPSRERSSATAGLATSSEGVAALEPGMSAAGRGVLGRAQGLAADLRDQRRVCQVESAGERGPRAETAGRTHNGPACLVRLARAPALSLPLGVRRVVHTSRRTRRTAEMQREQRVPETRTGVAVDETDGRRPERDRPPVAADGPPLQRLSCLQASAQQQSRPW